MLGQLPLISDPNVLVGFSNSDDAGVYRINDETAVVLTADFFTPIVDDPYWFGAIAAANSLSDVYAMGGRPIAAINIAALPGDPEFLPVNKRIMLGGFEKMVEAGVPVIGGHTIKDKEPKFGFAVLGSIHPDRILDNSRAKAGDALILTKPIGTGIISTGVKRGMCGPEVIEEFTTSMATLNRMAGELMLEVGVSTATDITGFGLIGHLHEVLSASNLWARLYSDRVPCFKEALRLAADNIIPGGTVSNIRSYSSQVQWSVGIPDTMKALLNDAQTSGGLLIFVPEEKKETLLARILEKGGMAVHIGDVMEAGTGEARRIIVER